MPRATHLATIAVAFVLLSGSLHAQSLTNTVSVSGEAEIRVVPDEVVLSLGVESFDPVLKTAKAANDERIKRTIAAARNQGVPAENIQTDYIGIEPRYRDGNIALELQGYVVRRTVIVRLRDVSRFENLLTDALDAGVTHVHGIEFRTTELRKHRDEARTLALRAAKEKAALLASELGRRPGAVQTIGEASYGYFSSYGSYWGSRYGMQAQNAVQSFGGAAVASDSALAPGQISIRVSVSATFALD
jgi:uncharacterized protein YggE